VNAVADALPAAQPVAADYTILPEAFHRLIPLFKKWGQTDDDKRSQRLARAARAQLRKLVAEVEPHFHSINRYLDDFGAEPIPAAAIVLGALAEAASEAQILLNSPSARKKHPKKR
jgi:hypothetical protein